MSVVDNKNIGFTTQQKYAAQEERRIAQFQQMEIYNLTFMHRLVYCMGVLFKWGNKPRKMGNDGSLKGRNRIKKIKK